MLNTVQLQGRIASDPEFKHTGGEGSTLICNFRLAHDRGRKDNAGNDMTDYITIVAFNKTAELVQQYMDKGMAILLEGRIQTRTWEKEGQRQYATEVVANMIHFIESKAETTRRREKKAQGQDGQGGQQAPPPPQAALQAAPQAQAPAAQPGNPFDDDPFGSD